MTSPHIGSTRLAGRRYDGLDCPIYSIIELLAHKWATDALYHLWEAGEPLRFRELQRRIQNNASVSLSAKELASRVRELEAAGVVTRTDYEERVPRVEYGLSERGRSLMPILWQLREWIEV